MSRILTQRDIAMVMFGATEMQNIVNTARNLEEARDEINKTVMNSTLIAEQNGFEVRHV